MVVADVSHPVHAHGPAENDVDAAALAQAVCPARAGAAGGLYVQGTAIVTLSHSNVTGNEATGGAAGAGGTAGLGQGGGVYIVPGGTVCVDRMTHIRNNHASTSDDEVFGDLCFI